MHGLIHTEGPPCGQTTVVALESRRPMERQAIENLNQWMAMAGCRKLVVDCSKVEFMSSEMLSRLVTLQRRLRAHNGELVLQGLRTEVRELFAWTKLDHFFTIQPDTGS